MDRNKQLINERCKLHGSLSARRAWIEMTLTASWSFVALKSLSARRAWIEILLVYLALIRYLIVALRKESVDRNLDAVQIIVVVM